MNDSLPPSHPEMPPVPQQVTPSPGMPALTSDDRNAGMLCHLLALAGLVVPLGSVIGPLVMWLTQKEKSAYVDFHGKESLNFQITMMIAIAGCLLLFWLVIPIFLAIAAGIAGVVFAIIGAIKASNGEYYRYPFCIRLVK